MNYFDKMQKGNPQEFLSDFVYNLMGSKIEKVERIDGGEIGDVYAVYYLCLPDEDDYAYIHPGKVYMDSVMIGEFGLVLGGGSEKYYYTRFVTAFDVNYAKKFSEFFDEETKKLFYSDYANCKREALKRDVQIELNKIEQMKKGGYNIIKAFEANLGNKDKNDEL